MLSRGDRDRLALNLELIRARIRDACGRCGRAPESVELVAVTKYAGSRYAEALVELGQRDLGENRVDHLVAQAAAFEAWPSSRRPRWHLIGHLQRNKVRRVAGLIDVLHSLDSQELVAGLERERPAHLPPLDTYVQVQLGASEGRSGVAAVDVAGLAAAVRRCPALRLAGLMGLPPLGTAEEARPYFRSLRELAVQAEVGPFLSMGMTSDLEVAIEEGATVVRVGRALLEGLSAEALAP